MSVPPRHFATLDGLRGVAALSVVVLHSQELMRPINLPSSFLAVDLFFMMSGFVIAHAYDPRLAKGMGFTEFMRVRLVRLFPLFLAGTVLGVAVTGGGLLVLGHTNNWTWSEVLRAIPFSLVMLPTWGGENLYPLNAPSWSILFEIIVNLAYVALWRPLQNTRVLFAALVVSLAALAGLGAWNGGLEMGGRWSDWAGLARASFGFLVGVGLHRLSARDWKAPAINPWLLFVIALAVFAAPRGPWSLGFDLGVVLLLFPVMVLAAANTEPHPRWTKAFLFLGATSYAVYAVNKPLAVAAFAVIEKLGRIPLERVSPWSGLAFLVLLLVGAWALDRFYDIPVRRWLNRATGGRARASATATS